MPSKRKYHWLPALLGAASFNSQANPAAGGYTDYAAAILMLLGFFAIVLGVRNLRGLRHKQPRPRQPHEGRRAPVDSKGISEPRSDA